MSFKETIIVFALGFIVLISITTAHELAHQYDFSKIEQICFFGYEQDADGDGHAAAGWVRATEYKHLDEKIPDIVGYSVGGILTVALLIIFRKDWMWWK